METDKYKLMTSLSEMERRYENRGIIPEKSINWLEPKTIVDYLNDYVAGQEEAKKSIACVFSSYMLKLNNPNSNLKTKNLLIAGPSGCGKTYMINTLCKKANIPIIVNQMTGKTPEGYRGKNLSTTFDEFFSQNRLNPTGIMFLDEIDKIAMRENLGFGESLQDELIGYFEGGVINKVIYEKGNDCSNTKNTKNILFIGAGAFQKNGATDSLEEIARKRIIETNDFSDKITPADLIEYGFKPELVGRFNTFTRLNPLSEDDLIAILSGKKNSLMEEHVKEIKLRGYQVTVDKDAIKEIVKICPKETGARGLSGICSEIFQEVIYDPEKYLIEKNKLLITSQNVKEILE